ncbi:MAG: hypothetical protein KGZ25_12475, partial [Planctomycetes bacterium]|nr:hypothetical protein [Planctomycetota bacterium]
MEVSNEFFALRIPQPRSIQFDKPASGEKMIPPILAWRPKGGEWMGGARFVLKEWKITFGAITVLRKGPACFEYEARYHFAPRGRYVWRLQMSPGMPVAVVTEELDAGVLKKNNANFLLLDLNEGWSPGTVGYVQQAGETSVKTGLYDFKKHIEKKRKANFKPESFGGTGTAPPPIVPVKGMFRLDRIVPGGKWGGLKGGIQLTNGETDDPQRVGLIPLHVGSWRRTMALNAWFQKGKGVSVGLPLDARWIWWQYDVADERSPFSTHEHDRDLKKSYARRVWGLYFGDKLHRAQWRFGHIGLDRYKEWQLDWRQRRSPAKTYPRAFITPEIVRELRKSIEKNPDRDVLQSYYVFSGQTEDAVRHGKQFLGWIRRKKSQWHVTGLSHYRQAGQLKRAHLAEDALACPDLPEKMRDEIRRYLALWSYLLSDPDFNPRGAGVHLGNNNMTINRTMALGYFASQIPDHPRSGYWMDRLQRYTRFKLATQTAPDGTWVACPNYQLYGPTRFLDAGINILRNTGTVNLTESDYHGDTLRYLANLTMQDPRFGNLRIIPGMGNSGDRVTPIFGLAMRAAAGDDEELAGYLRYMHQECVGANGVAKFRGNSPFNAFNFRPAIPPREKPLRTEFFPTYGVMFRNHANTPHETAMLFRAGMNWSHWDPDYFNVIIYGKGAPLSPGTGYAYGPACISANNAIYHNQVKLVKHDKKEIFGRVDAAVRDYGFGDNVDYAMADRFYPPELYEDKKERHWRRHILFVKGSEPELTSYFVMRDTFPGNPDSDRTWWTWLNLGEADHIKVDGTKLNPKSTPHDKVPDMSKLKTVSGRRVEMDSGHGAGLHFWFSGKQELPWRARLTFTVNIRMPHNTDLPGLGFGENLKPETKTIVEAVGQPGRDYFYVVWPYESGEKLPVFQKIGGGCIKVWADKFKDYNFISDRKLDFKKEDVVFTARTGSVRIFRDRIVFSITAGEGKIGYKEHIYEGEAPFERVVGRKKLKRNMFEVRSNGKGDHKSVGLGHGVLVYGEGPFEASLDGKTIKIHTEGRERVLHVTRPDFIRRPQYWVDGKEWMPCWTDWPASGFGRWTRTNLIGLTVPAGEHDLVVKDMVFPLGWERPFEPVLDGVRSP